MLRTITTASLLALLLACNADTTDPTTADEPTTTPDDDGGSSSGDDPDAATPLKVLPSATAAAIGAGTFHACALTTAGEVRCWGDCDKGQLGAGIPFTTPNSPVAVQVSGLASGVKSMATGTDFSCAVLAGGNVQCWGTDDIGQLGSGKVYTDSSMQASNVPVDVVGVSGATFVSAGLDSACATVNGGAIKCWGHDEAGKLGNNSPKTGGDGLPDSTTAVDVIGITTAVQVSVGARHACAVLADGALKCWGDNAFSQLGNAAAGDGTGVPVDVATGVLRVTAGYHQTCAVFTNGALKCWGDGVDGLLGDGKEMLGDVAATPQSVVGGETGGTDISLDGFACAVLGGGVKCWGASARLGTDDPSGFETYAPAKSAIGLESGVARVSVGADFACALTSAGGVKCWGTNGAGQMGNGKGGVNGSEEELQPVSVLSLP